MSEARDGEVWVIFDSIHSRERDFSPRTDKRLLPDRDRSIWISEARINHLWISSTNHSLPNQDNTSIFVDHDGGIVKAPCKRTAAIVNEVDTPREYWDPSGPFRDLALKGKLHEGPVIEDPRSVNRTAL